MSCFDLAPDKPVPFAYKIQWFAVKSHDPNSVVDALEFGERASANWTSGIAAAYEASQAKPWVFVSPPVNGWILIVSRALPYPTPPTVRWADIGAAFDVLFSRLMKRFDDVQFFANHRVSDFYAWARAQGREAKRIFAYGDGVEVNVGDQTLEEANLRLINLSGLTPSAATERIFETAEQRAAERKTFLATSGLSPDAARRRAMPNYPFAIPDETDVVALAGLWSIDPRELPDQETPPGFLVRLPAKLRG